MRRLLTKTILLLLAMMPLPASAAVTITFWSHELGGDFPHAFFTLRGTIDANGAPVDANFGFTAKAVTPALLFGTVGGRIDILKRDYIERSDAQFSIVLSDAQYADMLALVAAWDDKTGDGHYSLKKRNCVHFVQEAARRLGLAGVDQPKLMKRPRSYLDAVEAANVGRVTEVDLHGDQYLAQLAPVAPAAPIVAAPPKSRALPPARVFEGIHRARQSPLQPLEGIVASFCWARRSIQWREWTSEVA